MTGLAVVTIAVPSCQLVVTFNYQFLGAARISERKLNYMVVIVSQIEIDAFERNAACHAVMACPAEGIHSQNPSWVLRLAKCRNA